MTERRSEDTNKPRSEQAQAPGTAEAVLTAEQVEALASVDSTDTIGWLKPKGPESDWRHAVVTVRGQAPPSVEMPGLPAVKPIALPSSPSSQSRVFRLGSDNKPLPSAPPSSPATPRPPAAAEEEAKPSGSSASRDAAESETEAFSVVDHGSAPPPKPAKPAPPAPRPQEPEDDEDLLHQGNISPTGLFDDPLGSLGNLPPRAESSTDSDDAEAFADRSSLQSMPPDHDPEGLTMAAPEDDESDTVDKPLVSDAAPAGDAERPSSEGNQRLIKVETPRSREVDGVDTAAGTAKVGEQKRKTGHTNRLTSDEEMEGIDAAATIARASQALTLVKPDEEVFDTLETGEDGETIVTPAGEKSKGVAIAGTTSQVDMLATEADFVMRRMIGRGGQGEVWRAWQSSLHREVAVKRMISGDATEFLQEAYTSAELDHPNIVPVHDLGRAQDENGEVPLLAMKLVRGVPWNAQIAADRNSMDFSIEVFLAKHLAILYDVCNAVDYAHSKGIIHRDLKPQQVMVGDFGEVFLMDWGLAISVHTEVDFVAREGIHKHRTIDTAINRCGSPAYMAPEQTQESTAGLGFHTDIYLLGAIMYELVQGKPPHFAKTAMEAYQRAMLNECEPLPADAPPSLRDLIDRCLDMDASKRPQTVKALRASIQDYLSGADRQRESNEIVSRVELAIDTFGAENLEYEQLSLMEQQLGQSLQLWSKNPRAVKLRQRVILLHAHQALNAMDLQLARSLALSLPDNDDKDRLLEEIIETESERDKLHSATRFKRRYILVSVAFVVIAGVLASAYWASQKAIIAAASFSEMSQRESIERQLKRFEKSDQLRVAENALAKKLASLAPLPRSLDRMEAMSQFQDSPVLGSLLEERASLEEERRDLRRYVVLEPVPAPLLMARANAELYRASGDAQALATTYQRYRDVFEARPDLPEALVGMGVASFWADNATSATAHLSDAAILSAKNRGPRDPQTAAILAMAADAFYRAGQAEKGDELYRQLMRVLEPQWADLSLRLASYSDKLGEVARAAAYAPPALKALDSFPELREPSRLAEASWLAANNLSRLGRPAEAWPLYARALAHWRIALGDPHQKTRGAAWGMLRSLTSLPAENMPEDGPREALVLARWLRKGYLIRGSLDRESLLGEEWPDGWLGINQALAKALLAMPKPREDAARAVVLRSAALASLLELPKDHPVWKDFVDPMAERLGVTGKAASPPRPSSQLRANPGGPYPMLSLMEYLAGAAPRLDWESEFPGVDWSLGSVVAELPDGYSMSGGSEAEAEADLEKSVEEALAPSSDSAAPAETPSPEGGAPPAETAPSDEKPAAAPEPGTDPAEEASAEEAPAKPSPLKWPSPPGP